MKSFYVKEAYKLLKDGYVLESFFEGNRLVFIKEKAQIAVYSDKYTVFIGDLDFLDLYKDYTFSPIKEKEKETIDLKKDEEYYSSIQKKQ